MLLSQLHEVMQIAFEWHGYHLHSFETVCGEFGPVDKEDFPARKDETRAALGQVAAAAQAKIVYTYDFGDDWRHDIVVEQIVQAEPGLSYPRCTAGRRSAPREDSGGIWAHNENCGDDLPFDPGDMTEELADLAQVLIPA
jgi:Plasmid pRiA4b ORF-3-like protein